MGRARSFRTLVMAQAAATPLLPQDVAALYNLDVFYSRNMYGQGESIAFVEFCAPKASDDASFWSQYSLSPSLNKAVKTVDPSGAASEAAALVETDLDLQYAGALAPGAALTAYVVDGSLALGPFTSALWQVLVAVAKSGTRIVSISLGAGEIDVAAAGPFVDPTSGTSYADFASFAQALDDWIAAQGLLVFVAAGDSGAYASYPDDDAVQASWPAVQAGAIAVGGTQLQTPGDTTSGEEAWGGQTVDPSAPGYNTANTLPQASGGGGPAIYVSAPPYQAALGVATRQTPDVAAFAGPLLVVNDGQGVEVWGTSAAAPITAAIAALYHQSTGKWLNQTALYQAARDITTGSNTNSALLQAGLMAIDYAGVGYDLCTGAGAPDAAGLPGA
jgi:subtilase family serine protease